MKSAKHKRHLQDNIKGPMNNQTDKKPLVLGSIPPRTSGQSNNTANAQV